jgi:hypothetical protein
MGRVKTGVKIIGSTEGDGPTGNGAIFVVVNFD